MAHFAEIDSDNIVLRVLVVPDEEEHRGQEYMADDIALGGTWIQTSYNTHGNVHSLGGTPLHYNYAGIGSIWDAGAEAFHGPQPAPLWELDENFIWHCHDRENPPADGTGYEWDEAEGVWVHTGVYVWEDED